MAVDRNLRFAVPLGGNDRYAAAAFHIVSNKISVIAFICDENFRFWAIPHDRAIAFEIRDLAARDGGGYRQPSRVDAEMNF